MGISFAGVDLILEDPSGSVQEFLDDHIPASDLRTASAWPNSVWNSPNGLTQPNWSQPLSIRLSSWIWPTGASRWGFGYFLASQAQTQQIINAISSTGSASSGAGISGQNLVINDPANGYSRTFRAFLLPPHPVSADNSDPNGLWILPIVDQRFFWQFNDYLSLLTIPTGAFSSWNSVFSNLGYDVTPSSSYLVPNPWTLNRHSYQNTAVLFDVLAHSVGMRLVCDSANGAGSGNSVTTPTYGTQGLSFRLQTYGDANTRRNTLYFQGGYEAGVLQTGVNNFGLNAQSAVLPPQVTVVFRALKNGIIYDDNLTTPSGQTSIDGNGHRYALAVTAAQAGFSILSNASYTKIIRSTAVANFSAGNAAPDNLVTLTNLATQIATDFYGWALWQQDQSFAGVSCRQETGFDDYFEFNMGGRGPDDQYLARTRQHSLPHNFCCDDLQQWDSTTTTWLNNSIAYNSTPWQYGNVITGSLVGPLPGFGTQVIAVSGADVPIQASQKLVVSELNGDTFETGEIVTAIRDGSKWAVIDSGGDGVMMLGACASTITAGNSGSFIVTSGDAVTALVPYGVAIATKSYQITQTDAGTFQVVNPTLELFGQNSGIVLASATATMTLFAGTVGSEATLGVSVSANLRRGMIHANMSYRLVYVSAAGWEIADPTLAVRGQTTGDVAADATGTLTIYTGSGAGSASGTTISGVRNDSSCTIKTAKLAYAEWVDSLNGWVFDVAHTI